jgi:hypothetical protein
MVLNKWLRRSPSPRAEVFCVPVPAAAGRIVIPRTPWSPPPAGSRGLAPLFGSSGVPGRDRGRGLSPIRGYGTQRRARVPGEGKSQFFEKVNGRSRGLP